MAPPPDASVPQVRHVFAPGLRFHTELAFLAQSAGSQRRWRKLPTPEARAQEGAQIALRQAGALALGVAPSMRAIQQAMPRQIWSADGAHVAQRITASPLGLRAHWQPATSRWGQGGVMAFPAMACLEGGEDYAWALVCGIEFSAKAGEAPSPQALLLLDPRRAAPWGMAYNTRLVHPEGRWHGTDGEVGTAHLVGWLTLSARSPRR